MKRQPYVPMPGSAPARLIGVLLGMGEGVKIGTGMLAAAADVPPKQVCGLLRHALDLRLVQKSGGRGCAGLGWSLTAHGRARFTAGAVAQPEDAATGPDADLELVRQRVVPAAEAAPLTVTPRAWWGGPLDLDAMKAAGMNSDECSIALLEAHVAREHAELDDGGGHRA